MPDTNDDKSQQQEPEHPRPDLQEVPDNPPVEEQDVDRGRDQLDRVIAK